MAKTIDTYTPRTVAPDVWARTAHTARAWAHAADPDTPKSAYNALVAVARFCAWLDALGRPLDHTSLDSGVIDRYVTTQCTAMTARSRQTVRSVLRRVAVAEGVALPPRPLKARPSYRLSGYSPAEVASLWAWATAQNHRWAADIRTVVAAGVGAGLELKDLRWTKGSDVAVHADGTTVVNVAGERPRTVVALADWEAELARAAERAGTSWLFRPHSTGSRAAANLLTNYLAKAAKNSAPCPVDLDTRRLRTTWLVRLLSAGTPVGVVARASGLTLGGISAYLPLVGEPDWTPADATAALRCPRPVR